MTGIVRHPKQNGWFLKHDCGNSWSYTNVLIESTILYGKELKAMLERIPGSTWLPTKPWHEMPDGSMKLGRIVRE